MRGARRFYEQAPITAALRPSPGVERTGSLAHRTRPAKLTMRSRRDPRNAREAQRFPCAILGEHPHKSAQLVRELANVPRSARAVALGEERWHGTRV
jgi:hypothetical protein